MHLRYSKFFLMIIAVLLSACNGDARGDLVSTPEVYSGDYSADYDNEYWAELAQDYEEFVPLPEPGFAHDIEYNINFGPERWYPTSTTLASGQVVIALGHPDEPTPEQIHNHWYPALNEAPDGTLFHPGPSNQLFSIDLAALNNRIDNLGSREPGDEHRLYNTTIKHDIGEILITGRGTPAVATAIMIDLNGNNPVNTQIEPMQYEPSMQNTLTLPDEKVRVIGGNSSSIQCSDESTQLILEMWEPETGQWRSLAPHDKPRNCHSTDQRYIPLSYSKANSNTYQLVLSDNPHVLVPGYYWDFGLDRSGVPSEGHTLLVHPKGTNNKKIGAGQNITNSTLVLAEGAIATTRTMLIDIGIKSVAALGFINHGDSATYSIDLESSGLIEVSVTASAKEDRGGVINFTVDGQPVGSMNVPVTGSGSEYETASKTFPIPAGNRQIVTLEFSGGEGFLFNINHLRISGNEESASPKGSAKNLLNSGTFANDLISWNNCRGQVDTVNGTASLRTDCIYREFVGLLLQKYTATCDAAIPSGDSCLQLAISESTFSRLATDLVQAPSWINGRMTSSVTAPTAAANGGITLYIDEQGSFDNCGVTIGTAKPGPVDPSPMEPEPTTPVDTSVFVADLNTADTPTSTPVEHCDLPISPANTSTPEQTVGTGSAASCTRAGIQSAMDAAPNNGVIVFNCGGEVTIDFDRHLVMPTNKSLVLAGAGQVTFDGGRQLGRKTRAIDNEDNTGSRSNSNYLEIQGISFENFEPDPGQYYPPNPENAECAYGWKHGNGSAILLRDQILRIFNSEFRNNVGPEFGPDVGGAGFFVRAAIEVTVVGSTFENNRSANGGGFGVINTTTTNVYNNVFRNNEATGEGKNFARAADCGVFNHDDQGGAGGNGGAFAIDGQFSTNLTICGTVIEGNTAGGAGGGIFRTPNQQEEIITIDRTWINGNYSGQDGGGVYCTQCDMRAYASTFSNNIAYKEGGGLHVTGGSIAHLRLENVTVFNNTAQGEHGEGPGRGGGITAIISNDGTSYIRNSTIAYNKNTSPSGPGARGGTVNNFGGGLYRGDVEVSNSIFHYNTTVNPKVPMQCTNVANTAAGANMQYPQKRLNANGSESAVDDTLCAPNASFTDTLLSPTLVTPAGSPVPVLVPPLNSPAAGAGSGCLGTDATGGKRQVNGCTLGAYER